MKHQASRVIGHAASLLVASMIWTACGSTESPDGLRGPLPSNDQGSNDGVGGSSGGTETGGNNPGTGGSNTPPEQEVESSYETPVATSRFVWIANPISGRVAFVDAVTLQVQTTEVGQTPNLVAAVPQQDADVAIVLNSGSHTATLMRADDKGTLDSTTLPVAQDANDWSISKSGRWAISWTNSARLTSPDGPANGYQDITVLNLQQGKEQSTRLSVGYRPVRVSVASDDSKAFAITQDGISVIDLSSTPPKTESVVPITDDPLEDFASKDVHLTPDGHFAFVRNDGSADITVVDLQDGTLTKITLPGPVTDLDMAPDGSRAIAVVRDKGIAAVLPIPEVVDDPSALVSVNIEGATVGSVVMADEAERALLYTNATPQNNVVILDYADDTPTSETRKLHAPVLGAFLAPNANSAIILHDKIQQSGQTPYLGAFSVLNIEPALPAKIVGTVGVPQSVSLSADGQVAIITEQYAPWKLYGMYFVHMASQQVDRVELASPPIAAGTVPLAHRGFVAQKHPEGRITFVDLDTGAVRTLTGFELGAQIVDGS